MWTGIISLATKLFWAFSAIAAWFRIKAAKKQGRKEQAYKSLQEATNDENKANQAADAARGAANTGGVREPDQFTRPKD